MTLTADVMFVNGIGLFVRTYRQIKFTTLEYLSSLTKGKLGNSLKNFIVIYNTSGFKIRTALMDREFDCPVPDFPEININPTATSEHVPKIESKIRVIKEREYSIRIKLPFQNLTKRIIIDMMKLLVMCIN